MKHGFSRSRAILTLILFAVIACDEPGAGPPVRADSTPPVLGVVFPDSTADYDRDDDGFVDIEVHWNDNDEIDAAAASIRAIGDSAANTSLSNWTVVERSESGMVIREPLEQLLRSGTHHFELSIRDKAGNTATDTVTIELPASQFWKTITTNRPMNGWPVETAFCDDGKAYVASGTSIIVIDAARAELLSVIPDPYAVENLQVPLCVPGDSVVYVTPGAEQLRMNEPTWRYWPRPANLYSGIAQSRVNPDLLYAGEHYTGDLAVLSRSGNSRLRRFGLPVSEYGEERAFSVAVMPNDSKVYSTRAFEGGILVSDPGTGNLLKRIAPDGKDVHAIASSLALGSNDLFLYAAVQDAATRGVAEIDTRSDEVTRFLTLTQHTDRPTCLAMSPSGRRIFVGTRDLVPGIMSSNYMIDIPSWQILSRHIRYRQQRETRIDGCPAFRPDGKLVFLPRNMDVDVYLNRE